MPTTTRDIRIPASEVAKFWVMAAGNTSLIAHPL
jgi:hypothetical protein